MLDAGIAGSVYFVDDNFIGNKKAARELLPHLIDWQKRRGYPIQFSCEATLNIAQCPDILAMMREAYFYTVFCGIETPELGALDAMRKSHNQVMPLLDAVATINQLRHRGRLRHHSRPRYRHAGDRRQPDRVHRPLAHPGADDQPAAGPAEDAALGSAGGGRPAQLRPSARIECRVYPTLRRSTRQLARRDPPCLHARGAVRALRLEPARTPTRTGITPPLTRARLSRRNLRRGVTLLAKIVVRVGIRGDYRRIFWRFAGEGAARRAGGRADRRVAGRASHDPLRARMHRRPAERLVLRRPASRPSATSAPRRSDDRSRNAPRRPHPSLPRARSEGVGRSGSSPAMAACRRG